MGRPKSGPTKDSTGTEGARRATGVSVDRPASGAGPLARGQRWSAGSWTRQAGVPTTTNRQRNDPRGLLNIAAAEGPHPPRQWFHPAANSPPTPTPDEHAQTGGGAGTPEACQPRDVRDGASSPAA